MSELTAQMLERLAPHARELGCSEQLAGIEDLLQAGNGALRQQIVYEANHDLRELMAEIVASSGAAPPAHRPGAGRAPPAPASARLGCRRRRGGLGDPRPRLGQRSAGAGAEAR